MYQVKSLTGTALGSRNGLCFSVCYKKRKRKPGQSLQLDHRSRVRWVTARVQARKQLHRNGAVTVVRVLVTLTFGSTCPIIQLWCVFNSLPSRGISCFFPACGSVNLCVTLPRTQPHSLSLLWAPAVLPLQFHIRKDPVTNLRSSWPFTASFMPSSYVQRESYLLTPGILLPLD